MWWVNFRRGSELAGTAIIEAPTIYHARLRLALRGIGNAADYSDAKEVDAERAALIPRDYIGRLLLPDEAQKLRLLSPDEAFLQPAAGQMGNGHPELEGVFDAGF
jgi:hypothetical protein